MRAWLSIIEHVHLCPEEGPFSDRTLYALGFWSGIQSQSVTAYCIFTLPFASLFLHKSLKLKSVKVKVSLWLDV